MTKPEAAAVLVDMACMLRNHVTLTGENQKKLNEAIAMACGELMIDTILAERSKGTENDYDEE